MKTGEEPGFGGLGATQAKCAALLFATAMVALGQVGGNAGQRYFPLHTVSPSMRQIAAAAGERIQGPGRERVVMTGSLNRRGVASTVQVIRELPGNLRVDETGGKNKTLAFDGVGLIGSSAVDEEDEDLAESLESDTVEAFLRSGMGRGVALRWLGDRFKVEGETGFGSEVDIFEIVSAVKLRRDKRLTRKRFMFDSGTGLLRRVSYAVKGNGKTTQIQTVYSTYSTAGGSMLPGRVVRLADGAEVLSFTRTNALVGPGQADGVFGQARR